MTQLSTSQSKLLRKRAKSLTAVGSVGKAGLTEAAVSAVDRLLGDHELVKIRLQRGLEVGRAEVAQELAQATGSACVAVTGRTVVLYRANEDLPAARRIVL